MKDHEKHLGDQLRRALLAESERIEPDVRDGLRQIQQRIRTQRLKSRRLPWWQPLAIATATAAVAGVGTGMAMNSFGHATQSSVTSTEQPRPAASSSASALGQAAPVPSTSASPVPLPALPPSPAPVLVPVRPGNHTVPVYYVGENQVGGPRLYREFRRLPEQRDPLTTAVNAVLTMRALDPDYRSYWPGGTTLRSVTRSGDTVTVDVSGAARGLEPGRRVISLQQLVYTVAAVLQNHQVKVAMRFDGQAERGMAAPVGKAQQSEVQAPVWLTEPQEGDRVGRRLRLAGVAHVHEGTVRLQAIRNGEVVVDTHATAASGETFTDWSTEIGLEPGTYQLRAFEESAEDGSAMFVDTKTVQVR